MRKTLCAFAAGLVLSSPFAQAADPDLARNLAATCANCHGPNGNAVGDKKSLAGVAAEKTLAQLLDFRDGKQAATIMHQIAKGYTVEQLTLIAGYLATKTPKP